MLAKLRHELGDKFHMVEDGTIYELDAEPLQGQMVNEIGDRPVRFHFWGRAYGHSDECYKWQPPKKEVAT